MSLFPDVDNEIKEIKKQNKIKLEELQKMSIPYRPSNASEGMMFENSVCIDCKKYATCKVLIKLAGGLTDEVRQTDDDVFCISHTNFCIEDYLKEELKCKN